MSDSSLKRQIQYYQRCYQASFHGSEGHGLFDRDDVTILGVYAGNDHPFELTESHLSSWLVDSDALELVLFENIALYNASNASFTTDTHYKPVIAHSLPDLITTRLKQFAEANESDALAHFQSMLQGLDVVELKASESDLTDLLASESQEFPTIDLEPLPERAQVASWLIRQTKQVMEPSLCKIKILALVPKDLRAFQAKASFIQHLSEIADTQHTGSVLEHLLDPEGARSLQNPNAPLLGKVGRLGFGEGVRIPALSERQNSALQHALKAPVSLLQGPPGTGKSHALSTLVVMLASLNKSVLLSAGSDAALDVLQEKLLETHGMDRSLLVRFGKGQRHGRFAQQFTKLLSQPDKHSNNDELLEAYEALLNLQETVQAAERTIEGTIQEFPVPSDALLTGKGSVKERLVRWFFWQRQHKSSQTVREQISALLAAIEHHQASMGAVANASLKGRFQRMASRHKPLLSRLVKHISKAGVSAAFNTMRAEGDVPPVLQQGLGIWLCKLDDLPECVTGEFDCVIVDEATQINIASAIPAIAAAKSLVVSGDPKQLRHLSFLGRDQEVRIAKDLSLESDTLPSFRNTSFFDFVHDRLLHDGQTDAITLLDEHYRSSPPLMQFNSEQFYDDNVSVLTGLEQDSGHALKLSWRYVDGHRTDKINVIEIESVVEAVSQLIEDEAQSPKKTTIGVLSFFTDQTDALKKALLSALSLQDIRRHQLKVGTPFSFQGAERDHMFISCAVDSEAVAGTWTYLNRPDVFNVATSRAREKQTMFLSMKGRSLPTHTVLRKYHDFSLPTKLHPPVEQLAEWFSQIVQVFTQAGYQVETHHRIADVELDLLLTQGRKRLAIDLIGFPGDLGAAVHIRRYASLERVSIPLFALTAFDWMFAQAETLSVIETQLASIGSRLHATVELDNLTSATVEPTITTAPMLAESTMRLVNEPVWRAFLSASQMPELSSAWGFNLSELKDKFEQMDQLMPSLFEHGSLTYVRYQSALNTALEQLLENLKTYRLLHGQVWESAATDHDYWNELTRPVFERHEQISDVFFKLHREMQMEVAKSGQLDDFALKDLENLSERLHKY